MEYRKIGNTDIEVSRLSLGSWHVYSRLTFESGVDLLRSAFDHGINFFDVAYYRNSVHTEVIWSRLIRELGVSRDSYRLAGKLWYFSYPEESLSVQADRVLKRLGDEYMDIVIIEHPRPGMRVEKLVEEVSAIVKSGRARAWGALNWRPEDFEAAHGVAAEGGLVAPELAQLKYSVARRNVVDGPFERTFASTGTSLHASDSLEGGILAGTLNPDRLIGIDVGSIRDEIRGLVPKIEERARDFGLSAAQLSLAWCLGNQHLASLLFGATRPERFAENAEAVVAAQTRGSEIREALEGLGIDGHDFEAPYAHSEPIVGDYVA